MKSEDMTDSRCIDFFFDSRITSLLSNIFKAEKVAVEVFFYLFYL